MTVPDPRQEGGPPRPALRAGHRLLGLVGATFLIVLTITGIAIQHPAALGLDRHYAQSRPLLAWYGISAPEVAVMYVDQDIGYAQLDERIYRGQRQLREVDGELLGVVTIAGVTLVTSSRGVWLYDTDAHFIDRFDPPGAPIRIGSNDQAALLETDRGMFVADAEFLSWRASDPMQANWVKLAKPTQEQRQSFQNRYLDEALSWERLLLDLHSGRLFGSLGPYLVDAAALVLLIVAISGLWLATRPRRLPESDQ